MDAVKRIAGGGQLVPTGLHCHLGTFLLDPAAYARQVEKMVRFAYELEDQFGFAIEYLDIGGGLPSQNRLKATYLPPDVAVPALDEFAEQIGDALYRNLRPGKFPKLILECGRALVDEAGCLITTVQAAKRLADGTRAYVVDAGVNLLFTSFWYKLNVELDRETPGMNEQSVLYGPLCMNIDVRRRGAVAAALEARLAAGALARRRLQHDAVDAVHRLSPQRGPHRRKRRGRSHPRGRRPERHHAPRETAAATGNRANREGRCMQSGKVQLLEQRRRDRPLQGDLRRLRGDLLSPAAACTAESSLAILLLNPRMALLGVIAVLAAYGFAALIGMEKTLPPGGLLHLQSVPGRIVAGLPLRVQRPGLPLAVLAGVLHAAADGPLGQAAGRALEAARA